MKFVSFEGGFGALVDEQNIVDVSGGPWADLSAVAECRAWAELAKFVEDNRSSLPARQLADVTLTPPLPRPGKLFCVGVNYPDRNAEYKDGSAQPSYMSLFPRYISGFVGHDENLVRPPESEQLDYEGEIVLIIGKSGRRIAEADAYDHVAGVTLCNEGTIRDWVRHAKFNVTQGKKLGSQWRYWSLDRSLHRAGTDRRGSLETRVNGEVRQHDNTARMMFSFRRIINYISTFCTLNPGDMIVTGTPTGAGARLDPPQWLKPGDVIEVEVPTIGTLRNGVEDE